VRSEFGRRDPSSQVSRFSSAEGQRASIHWQREERHDKESREISIQRNAPDLRYGYPSKCFTLPEVSVMLHEDLSGMSQPKSTSFWPFFATDVKSASRGGTRWIGENQNAGTGCRSVNSMWTLLKYAASTNTEHLVFDSVAFTCVVDGNGATQIPERDQHFLCPRR